MADREKILRYFRSGGDEELAAKLLDLAENVQKSRKFKVSDFLDPHGLSVAEIVAANVGNIKIEVNGGFQNAERAKTAFVSEDFYGKPDFAIKCFQVEWDKRYYDLSHRDILGAFMALGCKREILGDIIFIPEGAQFVADKAFEAYITSNLTQIGAAPISLKIIEQEELQQKYPLLPVTAREPICLPSILPKKKHCIGRWQTSRARTQPDRFPMHWQPYRLCRKRTKRTIWQMSSSIPTA